MKKSFVKSNVSLFVSTLALGVSLAGCSKPTQSPDDKFAQNTGVPELEQQTGTAFAGPTSDSKAPTADSGPGVGANGFVSSDRLRAYKTLDDKSPVILLLNDKVEIMDPTPNGPNELILVRILESQNASLKDQRMYISRKYLNEKKKDVPAGTLNSLIPPTETTPAVRGQAPARSNRLYVVTNVATEKLRVYERCLPNEGCVSRMIVEADVVNGEDKDGTRTHLGSYRVKNWTKFYESANGKYPAWYKPGYPDVPGPDRRSSWIDREYMPNGVGDMRGAFGWYTVFLTPNSQGEWHHGTAGWGKDKKLFIEFKDTFWGHIVNIFASIRSHGCTRTDNETISYLRSLIPNGTPLVKVYAKEGYRDEARHGYNKQVGKWDYILTKVGAQKNDSAHQVADRKVVLAAGTPKSQWIEEGTYDVDQYPNAVEFQGRSSGGGDLYGIGSDSFRGVFLVDEGTLVGYRHPSQVKVAGMSDELVPSFMVSTNTVLSQPTERRSSRGPRGYGYEPN